MLISNVSRENFLRSFEQYFSKLLSDCGGVTGEGMRYASLDGGKRIRPLCVYFGALSVGGNAEIDDILPLTATVELVHNYSLVHDDMPEMDNDDMRRGKPSVHKRFGCATALLVGDGLLTLAMDQALKSKNEAAYEIAKAAMDMVYGQSAELAGCRFMEQWLDMYDKKTAALIRGAFRAGAVCAGADADKLDIVTEFSTCIGLAFQLADDLLDDDVSIVGVIGKDKAQSLLDDYTEQAILLAGQLERSQALISFAHELWHRKA